MLPAYVFRKKTCKYKKKAVPLQRLTRKANENHIRNTQ